MVPDGLDCATLSVPLNWDDPRGAKIILGMNRLRATSNDATENLFVNFGGPGGIATAAILQLANGAYSISPQVRKKYNLIGLDPRGIGSSTPLKCDIGLWNKRVSYFPKTEEDFQKLVQHNKALGESCLKESGDLLLHVDTISVARDFEAVRQALGSDKLNLLGFSYGTQTGSQYADLYPQNVGRLALDAQVDHSQPETLAFVTEISTYEHEFDRFVRWCSKSKACALHGQDVAKFFDDLVHKADKSPILAPACDQKCRKEVTGENLLFNIQGLLTFKPSTWIKLGRALAEANSGNATLLSTPLARSGQTEYNSGLFGRLAVGCSDWSHSSTSISDLLYKTELRKSFAPHTQGASQTYSYQSGCIGWPAPLANPPRALNVRGTSPILMVNALYDPSTSYEWAVGLQEQIESGTLLTRNGEGHTSYFLGGEAAEIMDAYLVNGTMPAPNTVVDS